MTPAIIKTRHLTKIFGMGDVQVTALNDVSFEISPGDFVAIMGPSGSGKSTLMHILGCLSTPTSGEYFLDGEDVSQLDKEQLAGIRNRKLGFVFQAYNLLPRTSALRNVTLPLFYNRSNRRTMEESDQKGRELLEKVGLGDRALHQPQELSGGQQQRVAIARALINDPMVIIADEPTGNLDSVAGEEIMGLLHDLNAQGTTIVMVTHAPGIAAHSRVPSLWGRIDNIVSNGHTRARPKAAV